MIASEQWHSNTFALNFRYAGHGSGLQYVNGRIICRARVRSVVFLFGCDSTRMLGTGLYSALYGAHDYYHGALCPSIVGTLMPALDGNMDTVSVTILSRWLAPGDNKVMPWTHIDRVPWLKNGIIKGNVLFILLSYIFKEFF